MLPALSCTTVCASQKGPPATVKDATGGAGIFIVSVRSHYLVPFPIFSLMLEVPAAKVMVGWLLVLSSVVPEYHSQEVIGLIKADRSINSTS